MTYRLSKSKLQAYAQCPKRLWLGVKHPELAVRDEMGTLIMVRGTALGEAVRTCFPQGHLIEARGPVEAVQQTTALMAQFAAGHRPRVPVFEAAFAHNDVVVYADLIEPDADGSWRLVEVKSGVLKADQAPKPHNVRDAATQAWVLRQCGVSVSGIELGQPDGGFVMPPNGRIDGILQRVDVTPAANALASEVEEAVAGALAVLELETAPPAEVGPRCKKPHTCSFIQHCTGAQRQPHEDWPVPVWHLSAEPTTRIVQALMADGYRNLADVPEQRLPDPMHRTMRAIAAGDPPYCDPALVDHLRQQPYPRYFLDYETNNAPLPLWRGTRPGERVVFQFSLHKWTREGGPIEHSEFLGDTLDDPRPELARQLAQALQEPGPVYAWNGGSTEGPITRDLARYWPAESALFERVAESCKANDPLRLFQKWFYHPAMEGKWSVKAIARALLSPSPYEQLEIANGVDAMREYEAFLQTPPGAQRDRLRRALLLYCKTDTDVMVSIWQAVAARANANANAQESIEPHRSMQ